MSIWYIIYSLTPPKDLCAHIMIGNDITMQLQTPRRIKRVRLFTWLELGHSAKLLQFAEDLSWDVTLVKELHILEEVFGKHQTFGGFPAMKTNNITQNKSSYFRCSTMQKQHYVFAWIASISHQVVFKMVPSAARREGYSMGGPPLFDVAI